jgi:hypothetical protein
MLLLETHSVLYIIFVMVFCRTILARVFTGFVLNATFGNSFIMLFVMFFLQNNMLTKEGGGILIGFDYCKFIYHFCTVFFFYENYVSKAGGGILIGCYLGWSRKWFFLLTRKSTFFRKYVYLRVITRKYS